MAKKNTEGLLIVEVPDLFAGLDLFEEGWQTAISGASEIAVAAATEDLSELYAAIAEPAHVTDEPIEVSLDSIFGEQQTSLLDQGPISPAAAAPSSVAAGPAEEKIQSQPLPAWRERESILEDIGRPERAVVLQRIGRRAVAVTPRDLLTAALLKSYVAFDKLGFAYDSEASDQSLQPITDVKCRSKDCRLYFPLKSLLTSPFIQESLLWKHLDELGLKPFVGPSLRNWVMKAYARIEREATPFNLPVIKDGRPMYDRMEVGLVVKCTEDRAPFQLGPQYISLP